ncbi:LLM class flavin-dependent oxidoreductase [Acuticoccus mangrovi]|uniref:LLM class flavin-dependent oxidoreductase n=1 Tax=Acuticoccus mangrovi TaxID=2796142 RepID=A0A934MN46_9HYPH|nr:LLM class flavin-dependent oxidoreductase [Acuticoccus mangrovi]MBJ3777854.1 LLM class flavin-dependent oxidoreductase [Acuticoccus mangrovi]
MVKDGKMSLALLALVNGHHSAGWRNTASDTDTATDIDYFTYLAQRAERAKFDLFFIADTPGARIDHLDAYSRGPNYMNCLEPTTLLSALARGTERIGLGGTASTSFYEPFNLARLFASLDHISHGRAAWNVVTSSNDHAARAFGHAKLPPHAERYARAKEFVEIVRALWDTYEDDAIRFDKATGEYFDPAKFHPIDHEGAFFKVRGALNIARPPQGQPVIIQAGASNAGRELAAETADLVFNSDDTFEEAKAYYDDVRARVARFGRDPSTLKVLAGFAPVWGESKWEAEDKHRTLQELVTPMVGKQRVGQDLEADLSGLDPDQPVPLDIIPASANQHTRYFEQLVHMIKHERLTLRQLWQRYERGNKRVLGTAKDIADVMEEWFAGKACDGFMVICPQLPVGIEEFADHVVPELQRRGLYREDYSGTTLRDHLGLARPQSRYARTAEPAMG